MFRSWRSLTCALALLAISAVAPAKQIPATEHLAVAGDAPSNPGPLATGLSTTLAPAEIRRAMRLVADWQVARVADTPSYDWTFATLYAGLLSASKTLGDPRYHDVVLHVAEHYSWKLGPRLAHADDQAIGQAYLELYREHPDPTRIAPLRAQFDELLKQPDDPARPVWWWCDALFMAPPVWARLSEITADPRYRQYMDREWQITSSLLWDPREHLFTRDASYLDHHEKNGRKVFWSRGNGWVMGGLVRVLEALPPDDPSRPFYVSRLQEMAAAVTPVQGADGLWRTGLLDPGSYPLPEISGSAFFTYSIAWGINHGILDRAKYLPVVQRAWAGMLGHIYRDGRLGCIQPIGEAPGAYSSGASYVFGTGAFLLAGSELTHLQGDGRAADARAATNRQRPAR